MNIRQRLARLEADHAAARALAAENAPLSDEHAVDEIAGIFADYDVAAAKPRDQWNKRDLAVMYAAPKLAAIFDEVAARVAADGASA